MHAELNVSSTWTLAAGDLKAAGRGPVPIDNEQGQRDLPCDVDILFVQTTVSNLI